MPWACPSIVRNASPIAHSDRRAWHCRQYFICTPRLDTITGRSPQSSHSISAPAILTPGHAQGNGYLGYGGAATRAKPQGKRGALYLAQTAAGGGDDVLNRSGGRRWRIICAGNPPPPGALVQPRRFFVPRAVRAGGAVRVPYRLVAALPALPPRHRPELVAVSRPVLLRRARDFQLNLCWGRFHTPIVPAPYHTAQALCMLRWYATLNDA